MADKELTKADLIEQKKPIIKKVMVPELGGFVYVRVTSVDEWDDYELSVYEEKSPTYRKIRSALLARTLCDSKGKRLFSNDPGEVESIGEMIIPGAMERIVDAARRINKKSEKDLKELEKNSAGDLDDSSSSNSASFSEEPKKS